jgi:hypothetical protein
LDLGRRKGIKTLRIEKLMYIKYSSLPPNICSNSIWRLLGNWIGYVVEAPAGEFREFLA